MFRYLLLIVFGVSFGALTAAGVFTVLIAVGLIPRFAGETHTSRYVFWYEEMVVIGTIFGSFFSVFPEYGQLGAFLQNKVPLPQSLMFIEFAQGLDFWQVMGNALSGFFGVFSGMFVGCLALAIAEMLDSIPIFSRRVSLRHGIGLVILAMSFGKLAGALFYFWQGW